MENPQKSKLFLVMSNHRSGSSATAGVLHHLGVHMGDSLLGAFASNPKGHFENRDFISMNDNILHFVGASWGNPPTRETILNSHFPANDIRSFVKDHAKPVWGLKDPRIALTFDIWKPHLEEVADITYVFVYRPVSECVQSLAHRENMDIKTAIAILLPYHNNLISYFMELKKEEKDIIAVSFKQLLNDSQHFYNKVNDRINTQGKIDLIKQFLEKELKHY